MQSKASGLSKSASSNAAPRPSGATSTPNYQCLQFENGAELNKILPQALEAQLHPLIYFLYSKFWNHFRAAESLLPTQERSLLI